MTEAEWLACEDPRAMFHWLRMNGTLNRPRLGLLFAACCDLIPHSVAEQPAPGAVHWTDNEYDQAPLSDAQFQLSGAVVEAMRAIATSDIQQAVTVAVLRDIFGNPFRPVTFSPSWRTSTAVTLAAQMYESRDFSAMPILADALQDAGCDSADVLDHCRGPGPHVRGCWVVDLVLGKE
ncbi:Uncharacterized protein (Fragment) OS=uncultured bacterium PE=4 SV=1 [Gemmata massiliana]|uniref:SMI1/KNR4 family protein n=2 Tax=Gemmata massiliana TaxID=1210884 RepID=A0A6P2CSI7_9BACT